MAQEESGAEQTPGSANADGPQAAAPTAGEDIDNPGPAVEYTLYECQECSTLVVGIYDTSPDLSCHGKPLEPITNEGLEHDDPELERLVSDVFGMQPNFFDICHFVYESGLATIDEVAEQFDFDRSTASRYLKRLAERGYLERHVLNRKAGGQINVYESRPLADTHRDVIVSFLRWAGKATMVIDEANQIKAQCAHHEDELDEIFWETYQSKRRL